MFLCFCVFLEFHGGCLMFFFWFFGVFCFWSCFEGFLDWDYFVCYFGGLTWFGGFVCFSFLIFLGGLGIQVLR